MTDIEDIVRRLRTSRKYRSLCEATVRRVAAWATARSHSPAEAEHRARRKLHQVYGAYLAGWDPRQAAAILRQLPPAANEATLRDVCRRILALHASTKERLRVMDRLYAVVLEATGSPRRVLDLGCGLHPFALPWMHLPPGCKYEAWEIDRRVVELVGRFLERAGVPGAAACRDVLLDRPDRPADVCFLLKMLPCLERQEEGCSQAVLAAVPARHVVVSFPVRSLGGRDVNMPAGYAAAMDALLAKARWRARRLDLSDELVYVVDKGG